MITKFLKSPRTIGSVTPSSAFLGRALCEKITDDCTDSVIELGSGTGAVTTQILNRLPSPDRLTCMELDGKMCSAFRDSFPEVTLLEKDCCEIESFFSGRKISNIVSSLPYRSLPKSMTDTIFEQKISLSNSQTVISLFSYDFVFAKYHKRYPIKLIDSRSVFLNFPPAKVYHYVV
jgi:phospholipid N-methyltransferase